MSILRNITKYASAIGLALMLNALSSTSVNNNAERPVEIAYSGNVNSIYSMRAVAILKKDYENVRKLDLIVAKLEKRVSLDLKLDGLERLMVITAVDYSKKFREKNASNRIMAEYRKKIDDFKSAHDLRINDLTSLEIAVTSRDTLIFGDEKLRDYGLDLGTLNDYNQKVRHLELLASKSGGRSQVANTIINFAPYLGNLDEISNETGVGLEDYLVLLTIESKGDRFALSKTGANSSFGILYSVAKKIVERSPSKFGEISEKGLLARLYTDQGLSAQLAAYLLKEAGYPRQKSKALASYAEGLPKISVLTQEEIHNHWYASLARDVGMTASKLITQL